MFEWELPEQVAATTDSDSLAPCKYFMPDGAAARIENSQRQTHWWKSGCEEELHCKTHRSVPGLCVFCDIRFNLLCRSHPGATVFDLAWFLLGPDKTGTRNRAKTDRATHPIKVEKAEGNVAWCILQLVGSSLSSKKSCVMDVYYYSTASKSGKKKLITIMLSLLLVSWISGVPDCVRKWIITFQVKTT